MKKLEEIVGLDNIIYNELMSKHTTLCIGGPADVFVKVDTVQKLQEVIDYAKETGNQFTIIGNGSNTLVTDKGIRGIVVKFINEDIEYREKEDGTLEVIVSAGVVNAKLAKRLLLKGYEGYEFAYGIPGTIGGAIVMNAGAYGKEIKECLLSVTYIDLENNEIHSVGVEECNFEYRNSIFKNSNNYVIISAKMLFKKGNEEEIKSKMNEYTKKRIQSQPIDRPNAGSTFKRGDGFITAQLIDEAGLKGYKIGGAEVSEKHAGFVVNSNNATAQDILDLTDYVKKVVKEKFDKEIELEMRIIGEE